MAYLPLTSTTSTTNSTTTPLGSGAAFTGTSVDITQYSSITVQVYADVGSATDGLSIQQSVDGTNWDNADTYTIPAATGKTFGVQATAQYLRVVYTNGGTAQATFRLQTVLHAVAPPTSSVRPQDGRTNDNDMQENIAYLMGFNGTTWDRLRSVNGGLNITGGQTSSPTTASWTSGTSANTAASVSVANYNTVSIALVQGSTITAGIVTFEVSMDNTNWLPIATNRVDVFSAATTYTLTASTNAGFSVSVDAFNYFRVRLSTAITGTGTVALSLQPQAFPIEPTVTIGQSTAANLNATVVGTGTLAVQNTAAIPTGSNTIGALTANQSVNQTQVGGNSVLTGNGVTGTGSQRVTIASDNTAFSVNATLQSGTNGIGKLTANSGVIIGDVNVVSEIPGTGATAIGKAEDAVHASGDTGVAIWAVRNDNNATTFTSANGDYSPIAVDGQGRIASNVVASSTGGYTAGKLISAASTNATNIKSSAGTLGYLTASNVNAAARYLKIYNKASAPTVGTDTPVHTFLIPGNTAGAGTNIPIPSEGVNLGTGISIAITTGVADSDTAAVAANEIVVNYGYI